MISILIAHDDKDSNRGSYFKASQEDLVSKIRDFGNINFELLNSETCLEHSMDTFTNKFDGNPFIFVGYLHGNETALLVEDIEFINISNAYLFGNTIFYACSCLSAASLGSVLIKNGCKVFLGFNSKISTVSNETEPIFFHCENAFISHFLTKNASIQDCLEFMYEEYEKMKIYLSSNYGIFEASILNENLNAFEIFVSNEDNYSLKNTDF